MTTEVPRGLIWGVTNKCQRTGDLANKKSVNDKDQLFALEHSSILQILRTLLSCKKIRLG